MKQSPSRERRRRDKQRAQTLLLVAVCSPAKLPDGHRLLLDVVLSEQAGLPGDHLLDGRWDDQLVDVVVALPRLPLLWGNDLGASRDKGKRQKAWPPNTGAALGLEEGRTTTNNDCSVHSCKKSTGQKQLDCLDFGLWPVKINKSINGRARVVILRSRLSATTLHLQ